MKIVFSVKYRVEGLSKEDNFENIPEEVSVDAVRLGAYLKKEIAKRESIERREFLILPHQHSLK